MFIFFSFERNESSCKVKLFAHDHDFRKAFNEHIRAKPRCDCICSIRGGVGLMAELMEERLWIKPDKDDLLRAQYQLHFYPP